MSKVHLVGTGTETSQEKLFLDPTEAHMVVLKPLEVLDHFQEMGHLTSLMPQALIGLVGHPETKFQALSLVVPLKVLVSQAVLAKDLAKEQSSQKNQLLTGLVHCPETKSQALTTVRLRDQECLVDHPRYLDLVNTQMRQDGIGHVTSHRSHCLSQEFCQARNLHSHVAQVQCLEKERISQRTHGQIGLDLSQHHQMRFLVQSL